MLIYVNAYLKQMLIYVYAYLRQDYGNVDLPKVNTM